MRIILLIFLLILYSTLSLFAQTHTAWVRTYSGPYGMDEATEVAVDKSGNVYVTGRSQRSQDIQDYATIKYYSNGATAWVKKYCGPKEYFVNPSDVAIAGPNDLVIDDSGNVYVTGFSPDTIYFSWYATIKYYPNGDTAWIRRYHGELYGVDGGTAIEVDDSHNVYVTGFSTGTSYDYGTIKYYPNGDTAWIRIYNGTGQWYDIPYDLALDPWGNVYVTGFSFGVSTNYDFHAVKNYPIENIPLIRRDNADLWYNIPYNLTLNPRGYIDVSGFNYNSGGNFDFATVKYYPNGDTAWVRRYDGPSNKNDRAYALCVDDSGYAYVTGYSYSDETNYDYVTIKYYPNGDTAWVRRYNSTWNNVDSALAVTVDKQGNVFVAGSSYGSGSDRDYAIIKYYPDGELAWERRYNGIGNSKDYAYDLAIDGSGNIYVTGYSKNQTSTYDLVTIKYNTEGEEICVKSYSSGVHEFFYIYPNNIDLDSANNVYVAGSSGNDYVTIKYFPIGMAGDANGDVKVSIFDVFYLLDYLYRGADIKNTLSSSDVNDDGSVNLKDVVYLLNYLFKGGPPPIC